MVRFAFILTFCFLTITQVSSACDCGSEGKFLEVAPKAELVALVKVTKYLTYGIYSRQTPMSMEVEIIDVYRGKETRKTITVWGDNGILCRPFISQFNTGKYYVIAFYKALDGSKGYGQKKEKPTDYAISICGNYWVMADVNRQKAIGAISNELTEIKVSELKSILSLK